MNLNALGPNLLNQVYALADEGKFVKAMEVAKKIKFNLFKRIAYGLLTRSCAKAGKLDLAITAFQYLSEMKITGPFYNTPLRAIFKKLKEYNEQHKNIASSLSPPNKDFIKLRIQENNKVWDNLGL